MKNQTKPAFVHVLLTISALFLSSVSAQEVGNVETRQQFQFFFLFACTVDFDVYGHDLNAQRMKGNLVTQIKLGMDRVNGEILRKNGLFAKLENFNHQLIFQIAR